MDFCSAPRGVTFLPAMRVHVISVMGMAATLAMRKKTSRLILCATKGMDQMPGHRSPPEKRRRTSIYSIRWSISSIA